MSEPTVDRQLAVVPANEASWDDPRAVFGTGCTSRCLRQRFKIRDRDRSSFTPEMLAERFREETGCDDPGSPSTSGLVAYLDGEPVGWFAAEPRSCYPHLRRTSWAGRDEDRDDPTVWGIAAVMARKAPRPRATFVRVGICVVVDTSGSVSSAGRWVRPAHTPSTNGRVRIRQVARKGVLRVDAR